jgi:hypothetical protein
MLWVQHGKHVAMASSRFGGQTNWHTHAAAVSPTEGVLTAEP